MTETHTHLQEDETLSSYEASRRLTKLQSEKGIRAAWRTVSALYRMSKMDPNYELRDGIMILRGALIGLLQYGTQRCKEVVDKAGLRRP